jgi:hypothetical protein
MIAEEPWSEERTRAIVADHSHLEGPLMPILHAVQETFTCMFRWVAARDEFPASL